MAALSKLKDQVTSAAGVSPKAVAFGAVTAAILWKLMKTRSSSGGKKKSVHTICVGDIIVY